MKNKRILIVEDQRLHQIKAQRFCETNGYEVVGTTDNAEEAFRLAQAVNPDVALVDIRLQGERSGIDFARSIRRERDGMGIIFLTSLMSDEVLQQAAEVKPEGFLVKPFDASSLKAAVELVFLSNRATVREEPFLADIPRTELQIMDHLFIKIGNMFKKVALADVVLIRTTREKYADLLLISGRLLSVRLSLSQMEELLPGYFWRVHRNHIVNSQKIEAIDTGWKSLELEGETVAIGRSYRQAVSERFPHIS